MSMSRCLGFFFMLKLHHDFLSIYSIVRLNSVTMEATLKCSISFKLGQECRHFCPSLSLPRTCRITNSKVQGASEAESVKVEDERAKLRSKAERLIPNARVVRDKGEKRLQHSLGIDLGDTRTGIAISYRGFAPSPLAVTELHGDRLLRHLMEVASKQRADEFIVGLPISFDGKETTQSNKTRSFAGRLAQCAAERGWRVYLYNEHGTSKDALDYMIQFGSNRRSRKDLLDAYAAMMLLRNYFENGGAKAQLVLPKKLDEQERLFSNYETLTFRGTGDDSDDY